MMKKEKNTQSAIDRYEREQTARGNFAYAPMDAVKAFKESQRELKKIKTAKAMGIEPPKYDGRAWNEYFQSYGLEIAPRLKELQNPPPITPQDKALDAPTGQDQGAGDEATETSQNA